MGYSSRAASRAYLNPVLQAYTSNMSVCSLNIFMHIPKTGGTSVDDLFYALAAHSLSAVPHMKNWSQLPAGAWVTTQHISKHYPGNVLLAMLKPIYDDVAGLYGNVALEHRSLLPDWRRTNIYHTVHAPPAVVQQFHTVFLPRLAQLRDMYRQHSCPCRIFTVLREPTSLLVSSYRYYRLDGGLGVAPTLRGQAALQVRSNATSLAGDFARWIALHHDPQARFLNSTLLESPDIVNCHSSGMLSLSAAPPLSIAESRELLSPYDLVAFSEELYEFLWLLLASVGVYLPAIIGDGGGLSVRLPLCNTNGAKYSGRAMGNVTQQPLTKERMACAVMRDAVVYEAVRSRSASQRKSTVRERTAQFGLAHALTFDATSVANIRPLKLQFRCHKGTVTPELLKVLTADFVRSSRIGSSSAGCARFLCEAAEI